MRSVRRWLTATLAVELLSTPVFAQDTTTPDLLPGVDLVTEEVEPGVYRVLSDGIRQVARPIKTQAREVTNTSPAVALAILASDGRVVAGADGSLWLFRSDDLFRLGDALTHSWTRTFGLAALDIEVPVSGRPMAFDRGGPARILALDGGGWTPIQPLDDEGFQPLDWYAAPDGTIWVSGYRKDRGQPRRAALARFDAGVWTEVEPPPGEPAELRLWGTDQQGAPLVARGGHLHRLVDGAWVDAPIAPDAVQDELQQPLAVAGLPDDGVRPRAWAFGLPGGPPPRVASSGTAVWYAASTDDLPQDHESLLALPRAGCDGLVSYDGLESRRYLAGSCVYDIDIGGNGAVWVLAGEWEGSRVEPGYVGPVELYLIHPEAGAVAE